MNPRKSESKSEGYHFWAWPLTGRAAKRGVPPACAPTAAPREAGANMGAESGWNLKSSKRFKDLLIPTFKIWIFWKTWTYLFLALKCFLWVVFMFETLVWKNCITKAWFRICVKRMGVFFPKIDMGRGWQDSLLPWNEHCQYTESHIQLSTDSAEINNGQFLFWDQRRGVSRRHSDLSTGKGRCWIPAKKTTASAAEVVGEP